MILLKENTQAGNCNNEYGSKAAGYFKYFQHIHTYIQYFSSTSKDLHLDTQLRLKVLNVFLAVCAYVLVYLNWKLY